MAEGTSRWLLWMLRRYERLIERYCQRFGFDGDYGLFEDACTDARLFGHGIG